MKLLICNHYVTKEVRLTDILCQNYKKHIFLYR